jgi:N-acetylglutamate synthase-like GNAT family acetyltransferase
MSPALNPVPPLRPARIEDVPALEELIALSVRELLGRHYSPRQIAGALGPVFGVDRQLIRDGTYFVLEESGHLIAGGGWSRRRAPFGGDAGRAGPDPELNPATDAARIRAFFVHPDWERRGLGRALLAASESAARAAGFRRLELVATLAGEPLYRRHGFTETQRTGVALANGEFLQVVHMAKPI